MSGEGWHRLHPVSPVVRAGRGAIAIAIVVLPSVLGGRDLTESAVQFGIVGVVALLGFVSWLVTRWCIDGDDLRIETGVLRRRSLRFPLSQVQAIDIVRPGLARMFRVAELRLRMAGSTGSTARLAYLPEREVEPLRLREKLVHRNPGHLDQLRILPARPQHQQVPQMLDQVRQQRVGR